MRKKIANDDYVNFNDIEELNKDGVTVFMMDGGREIGKSYTVKLNALTEAYNDPDNCKFIYMRRKDKEINTFNCEKYFNSKAYWKMIEEVTGGEYNRIFYRSRTFYFGRYDSNWNKEFGMPIGYAMSLFAYAEQKSLAYEDVKNIIFEEWQTDEPYLRAPSEPERVMSILSTVRRGRGDVKLFMIANLITPISPYVEEWNMKYIEKQKPGTIQVYDVLFKPEGSAGEVVKVARIFYENVTKRAKEIDKYAMPEYKHSKYEIHHVMKNDKVYHTITLEYKSFRFLMRLIKVKGVYVWHVTRKTSPVRENERVISTRFYLSQLYSNRIEAIVPEEVPAIEIFKKHMFVFDSDLIGENFHNCLKNFY